MAFFQTLAAGAWGKAFDRVGAGRLDCAGNGWAQILRAGRTLMTGPLEDRREQLMQLCRDFRVKRLEAFGSATAQGQFDPERSDIDLLVEFEPMDPVHHAKAYFGLLAALQDLFARQVDLLEIRAVANPYLLESIEKQRRQIYAA